MMDTLEDLPGLKKVKILQSKYQLGADIYEAGDRKKHSIMLFHNEMANFTAVLCGV